MKPTKPDFRLVAIDCTRYWDLSSLPEIEKCLSIYLVDFSTRTFCCETTPSYYLILVAEEYVYKPDVDPSEDRREEIQTVFDESLAYYEHGIYMHCASVEKLPSVKAQLDESKLEDFLAGEITERQLEESVLDIVRSNYLHGELVK